MARVSLRTLGTVRIEAGQRSIGPGAGRPFALVLYLMCRRGQPTPRRILQELLFPGRSESRSTHSLRQLVYRVRQLGIPVDTDSGDVQIAAADAWIDWSDILERGELGNPDMELVAQGLFPGFSPDVSEGYREWFEAERSAVRLRLSRAVGLQLTQLRRAGRWDLVDTAARALLALDPLSEEGTLARAEALAASGSKTAALGLIDDYLKELGDDQANLRLTPSALRRRISERLPEMGHRAQDDRIFVGREDAMRMLSAAGAAARAGTQQTVLVWGEPGIGKTRLLQEYKALACLQGAVAFQVTCQPHDVYRPLGILSDLVAELLEAPGALGCDPDAGEVLSRLVTTSTTGSSQHHLQAPLSIIITALEDLLDAISCESQLVILIDDSQWLDRTSLKAALAAFALRSARRTCLILASRDRALLTNNDSLADNVKSIRLSPLARGPAIELTSHLLAGAANSSLIHQEQIVEQGRGNPFFIRQLCSSVTAVDGRTAIFRTVGEILERRLEQLSPEAVRTLEACAVLGTNSTYARLERVLRITRLQLLRALEELDDRGLVDVRDGCFLSSHALLSEAVLSRMSVSVTQALHAASGAMLQEECGSSQVGPLPWACAEHWRLAGHNEQAIEVLRNCAQRALDIGRPTDAFATLKRATGMDCSESTRLQIIESALETLWLGVNWADARELFAERRKLRGYLGLEPEAHDVYETLEFAAAIHSSLGDPRANIAALKRCVTAVESSAEHKLAAARQLVITAELTLEPELARLAFKASRGLAAGTHRQLLCDLMFHTCFGAPKTAEKLAGALAALAAEDHPSRAVWLLNAGYAQYRVGNSAVAERMLLEGLQAARRYRSLSNEMHASLLLARFYWSTERLHDCRVWHGRYSEVAARNDDPSVLGEHSVLGARLALRDGAFDLARRYLDRANNCDHACLDLPRLLALSCEIDLQVATNSLNSLEYDVEEALSLYLRSRSLGCQDDVVTSIVNALLALDRGDGAALLLREYLERYRRDGFLVPSALLEARERLTKCFGSSRINPIDLHNVF